MQQYTIKQLEYFQYIPLVGVSKGALFFQNSRGSFSGYHCPCLVSVSTLEWEGSNASVLPSRSPLASCDGWRLLDYSSYSFLNSVASGERAICERNDSVTTHLQRAHQETLRLSSHVSHIKVLHLRTEGFLSLRICSECNLMAVVA